MAGKLGKKGVTSAVGAVEAELLKTLGQEPKAEDEEFSDYVERLLTAEVTDEDYEALSAEAQKWYDAAVALYNADKLDKVSKFAAASKKEEAAEETEDDAAEETEEQEEETEEQEEEVETLKSKKETKMKKEVVAKKEAAPKKEEKAKKEVVAKKEEKVKKAVVPAKEKKEKKGRELNDSPSSAVRQIVCKALGKITVEEVKAKLKEQGIKISDGQLGGVHNVTTRVIRTLQALGKL